MYRSKFRPSSSSDNGSGSAGSDVSGSAGSSRSLVVTSVPVIRVGSGGYGVVEVRIESSTNRRFVRKSFKANGGLTARDMFLAEKDMNDLVAQQNDRYDTIARPRQYNEDEARDIYSIDYEMLDTDLHGFIHGANAEDESAPKVTGLPGLQNVEMLLALIADGLRALAFLHDDVGIIHRDIKPQNMLLTFGSGSEGIGLKICDLGVGQRKADVDVLSGTRIYMAPEMWGDEKVDSGIDVFAYGLTLHEMLELSEVVPYYEGSLSSVKQSYQVFWDTISSAAGGMLRTTGKNVKQFDVPANVLELVNSMMTIDPAKRPSAADLLRDPVLRNVPARMRVAEERYRRHFQEIAVDRLHSEAKRDVAKELSIDVKHMDVKLEQMKRENDRLEKEKEGALEMAHRNSLFMTDQQALRRRMNDALAEEAKTKQAYLKLEMKCGAMREEMLKMQKEKERLVAEQSARKAMPPPMMLPPRAAKHSGLTHGTKALDVSSKKRTDGGVSASDLAEAQALLGCDYSGALAQMQQYIENGNSFDSLSETQPLSSSSPCSSSNVPSPRSNDVLCRVMQNMGGLPVVSEAEKTEEERAFAQLGMAPGQSRHVPQSYTLIGPPKPVQHEQKRVQNVAIPKPVSRKRHSEDSSEEPRSGNGIDKGLNGDERQPYVMKMKSLLKGSKRHYDEVKRIAQFLELNERVVCAVMSLVDTYHKAVRVDHLTRKITFLTSVLSLTEDEKKVKNEVTGSFGTPAKTEQMTMAVCILICGSNLAKAVFGEVTGRVGGWWDDGGAKLRKALAIPAEFCRGL